MMIKYPEVFVPIVKTWFENVNLLSCGSLTPFARTFEKGCDVYEQSFNDVQDYWMNMFSQIETDLEANAAEAHSRPTMSEHERTVLERTQPDYANLRAVASGESMREVLDDETYAVVGFSSTAKSSHKYDEADRGRDIQRHHAD